MAQTTPNYGLTIAEGTDTVNLLTQCYPNFSTLDTVVKGIADTGVTTASETKSGTVHQLVRSNPDCNIFRFTATSNFVTGDTFTVDGSPVTAVSVSGTSLQSGDFVINSNVLAIVNGGVLTVLVGGSAVTSIDADDVVYDNTLSGLTATDAQAAIDELAARPVVAAAEDVTYDNTVSGLTATDVQAAIDELKALIPATPTYSTAGLTVVSNRCTINSGGYYVEGSTCYVDITVTASTALSSGNICLNGFPQASTAVPGTGSTPVTGVFNNMRIAQHSALLTSLEPAASIASGTAVHFIGSYTIL